MSERDLRLLCRDAVQRHARVLPELLYGGGTMYPSCMIPTARPTTCCSPAIVRPT